MRAPLQVLVIPYKIENGIPFYCVMHRADADWWQFIAGGGEDSETPIETAKRETFEESGIETDSIFRLTAMSYVPANCISERHRKNWPANTYVLPEYFFAFETTDEIKLSHEHIEYKWATFNEAESLLHWQTNVVAMYELKCRLEMR